MTTVLQRTQASLTVSVGFLAAWSLLVSAALGGSTLATPFVLGGLTPIALLLGVRVWATARAVNQGTYLPQRAAFEGALLGAAVAVAAALGLFYRTAQTAGTATQEVLTYQLLPTAVLLGGALGAAHGLLAYFVSRKLVGTAVASGK